jgi:hypothetical protein
MSPALLTEYAFVPLLSLAVSQLQPVAHLVNE